MAVTREIRHRCHNIGSGLEQCGRVSSTQNRLTCFPTPRFGCRCCNTFCAAHTSEHHSTTLLCKEVVRVSTKGQVRVFETIGVWVLCQEYSRVPVCYCRAFSCCLTVRYPSQAGLCHTNDTRSMNSSASDFVLHIYGMYALREGL